MKFPINNGDTLPLPHHHSAIYSSSLIFSSEFALHSIFWTHTRLLTQSTWKLFLPQKNADQTRVIPFPIPKDQKPRNHGWRISGKGKQRKNFHEKNKESSKDQVYTVIVEYILYLLYYILHITYYITYYALHTLNYRT